MLHATPHGVLSWDFTISRDSVVVADIDMAWFREQAEVKIGQQLYSLYRDSLIQGTFALRSGDRTLAQAQKVSVFKRTFRVDVGGRKLMLKAASAWRRQIEVHEDDALIGRIGPTGWAGRTSVIDLPADLSLPVQVFLFWLVIILWRRDDSGAVGAIATS